MSRPPKLPPIRAASKNTTGSSRVANLPACLGPEGVGSTSNTAANIKRERSDSITPPPATKRSREETRTRSMIPMEPTRESSKRSTRSGSAPPSAPRGEPISQTHTKRGPEVGHAEETTEDDVEPWAMYRRAVATKSISLSQWSTNFTDAMGITNGRFTIDAFTNHIRENGLNSDQRDLFFRIVCALKTCTTPEAANAYLTSLHRAAFGSEYDQLQEWFTLDRNTWFLTGSLSRYNNSRSTEDEIKIKDEDQDGDENENELDVDIGHDNNTTSIPITIAHVIMLGHTHDGMEGALEAARAMKVFNAFSHLDQSVSCLEIADKVWPATLEAKKNFARSYLHEVTQTTGPDFEKTFIEKHAAMIREVVVRGSTTNPGKGKYPDMPIYPEINTDINALLTVVTASSFAEVVVPTLEKVYDTEITYDMQVALWANIIQDGVTRYNPWTQELNGIAEEDHGGVTLHDRVYLPVPTSQIQSKSDKGGAMAAELDSDHSDYDPAFAELNPDCNPASTEADSEHPAADAALAELNSDYESPSAELSSDHDHAVVETIENHWNVFYGKSLLELERLRHSGEVHPSQRWELEATIVSTKERIDHMSLEQLKAGMDSELGPLHHGDHFRRAYVRADLLQENDLDKLEARKEDMLPQFLDIVDEVIKHKQNKEVDDWLRNEL